MYNTDPVVYCQAFISHYPCTQLMFMYSQCTQSYNVHTHTMYTTHSPRRLTQAHHWAICLGARLPYQSNLACSQDALQSLVAIGMILFDISYNTCYPIYLYSIYLLVISLAERNINIMLDKIKKYVILIIYKRMLFLL